LAFRHDRLNTFTPSAFARLPYYHLPNQTTLASS
jgi:hypothetical protein